MPGDTSKWKAIHDFAIRAGGKRVQVGIFNGVQGATGQTVEIGLCHEYGTRTIPERSYIRSTIAERKAELNAMMSRVVKLMIERKIDEGKALSLVGAWLSGAIKAQITTRGTFAPLKPRTIARKGSDKPLIDTAQMLNSITFIIVD